MFWDMSPLKYFQPSKIIFRKYHRIKMMYSQFTNTCLVYIYVWQELYLWLGISKMRECFLELLDCKT